MTRRYFDPRDYPADAAALSHSKMDSSAYKWKKQMTQKFSDLEVSKVFAENKSYSATAKIFNTSAGHIHNVLKRIIKRGSDEEKQLARIGLEVFCQCGRRLAHDSTRKRGQCGKCFSRSDEGKKQRKEYRSQWEKKRKEEEKRRMAMKIGGVSCDYKS